MKVTILAITGMLIAGAALAAPCTVSAIPAAKPAAKVVVAAKPISPLVTAVRVALTAKDYAALTKAVSAIIAAKDYDALTKAVSAIIAAKDYDALTKAVAVSLSGWDALAGEAKPMSHIWALCRRGAAMEKRDEDTSRLWQRIETIWARARKEAL